MASTMQSGDPSTPRHINQVDRARILRGKRKGEVVELHQYCNDWASLKDGSVIGLGSIECDIPTTIHFMNQQLEDSKEKTSRRMGQMFRMYYQFDYFVMTGKFRRLKHE